MKRVEMTVVFQVEAPDEADVDDLTLDVADYDVLTIGVAGSSEDSGGYVVAHETTVCIVVEK